jgi:hypothetical protein
LGEELDHGGEPRRDIRIVLYVAIG